MNAKQFYFQKSELPSLEGVNRDAPIYSYNQLIDFAESYYVAMYLDKGTIFEVVANFELHIDFGLLISQHKDIKIIRVVEMIGNKAILYVLDVPKEKQGLVADYGLHTFIKNPTFQKYYHHTEAFKRISELYLVQNKR